MSSQTIDEYRKELLAFKLPRFKQLPELDLYMDQLLYYIETHLEIFNVNEKLLTTAMVNNYVKQKLISPTSKKRYTNKHIACLIIVCFYKQIYSIPEICELIEQDNIEQYYDSFCDELEAAIIAVFDGNNYKALLEDNTNILLRSSVISFTNKLFVEKHLQIEKELKKEKELQKEKEKEKEKAKSKDEKLKDN